MATAGPQTDTENYDLECAVCTEILRDARLLRCGHHFCRVCLGQISDRHSKGAVPCPTCRQVTTARVDQLPRYAAASEFSRRVTDALEKHGGKEEPMKCDVCVEADAIKTCFACSLCFCPTCAGKHSGLEGINPGHKLLPMSSYMFCRTHTNKRCQAYCVQCNKMCCPICAIGIHKSHKLEDLNLKADTLRAGFRQSRADMDAAEMETETTHRLKQTLDTAVNIRKTFNNSIAKVKQTLKDMLTKVETLEQEVCEKMEASIKLLKAMNTDMDDYMGSKVTLRGHLTYLIETSCDAEVVGRQREVPGYDKDTYRHVISTAEVEIPELGTTLTDIQAQLDKCKQQLQVDYTTYHLLNEGSPATQHDKQPFTDLGKVMDIDVGMFVFGMAIDSGRQRLVVRRNDTTAPVSVYNFQGQRLQVLGQGVKGISGNNWLSIAIDSKRDLYLLPMQDGTLVTMDMNGTIQDKMKVSSGALVGVSYSNEDIYVTSSCGPHQVYLINPKTKQTLNTFSPKTTFKHPYNVCTGQFTVAGNSTPVIMVSDYSNHCIKVLNMTGELLHTYDQKGKARQGEGKLIFPWCVCTGPGGRVVMGNTNNNHIVSFWREGDRDMSLILLGPDKLKVSGHPSIAIDPVSRKLFVGSNGLRTIQVFQG